MSSEKRPSIPTASTPPPDAPIEACYDDMEQGLAAEAAALTLASHIPPYALPEKEYLESTVLPLLLHGLEALAKERPVDPIEYLAAYLISNNPQRDEPLPEPLGSALLSGQSAANAAAPPVAPPAAESA